MDDPGWSYAEGVVELDLNVRDGYMKHHVEIPAACCLDAVVGVRVEGTLEGARFSRVVTAGDDGRRLLRFGRDWLRAAGIEVGEPVALQLRVDPDPDRVEIPEELAAALAQAPELEHRWESLTAGRRRTLVHPIERARRPETRANRVQAALDALSGPTV